jgi:3-phosphoshikimate 1-carboxyvinyltransferase
MLPALRIVPVESPIRATLAVPGSKSSAARLLIGAALANGRSVVAGVPAGDDCEVLLAALRRLGVECLRADDVVTVNGTGGRLTAPGGTIDVHRSGTALRFLLPLIAASTGPVTLLDGDPRLRERPIKPLVDALTALGAVIECTGNGAPLRIIPQGALRGGHVSLDPSASSQFVSALLLSAPLMAAGLTVTLTGPPVSAPYIALTIEHLTRCGIEVERLPSDGLAGYHVAPQPYRPIECRVPPDASTASYLWALAAVTGGEVIVTGLDAGSHEPDMQVVTALGRMGCGISGGRGIGVGRRNALRAVTVNGAPFPDGAMTVGAVGAYAEGETTIAGLGTLRHKESDRLHALVELFRAVSIDARVEGDALIVQGGRPLGGRIRTHADHRLAMIGGVLGAVTPGVTIEAPHVVGKSCPEYWSLLRSLGVKTEWVTPPVVALVGFMGVGKSSVARRVGELRGVPVVELDEVIRTAAGVDSIAALFAAEGEGGFRERERRALGEALERLSLTGGIVSTGGGVIERAENGELLRGASTVVYLAADFDTISHRLRGDTTRPLWHDRERAHALYRTRAPRYAALADIVIDTATRSLDEVAVEVGAIWCEGVAKC